MSRRLAPRPMGIAIRAVRAESAPATPLASAQAVWAEVVGESIAAAAEPVSERGGVLKIACASGVWADQLDLMQGEIVARLIDRLGDRAPGRLRCVVGSGDSPA